MDLDITRILRILPHRSPFVLIDRVVEIQPRKSARAIKCVTYNEPFFPGHFPSHPVFPSVLILEAMAQLTAILAYASEPFDSERKVVYFLGIDGAKFRKPVVPGDRMTIDVEVSRHRSNIWKTDATAHVDEALCAQAQLLDAMKLVSALTQANAEPPRISLRTHRAGDMGWIVMRHGALYAEEYGWDETFDALVAEIAGAFVKSFDARRERCWIAEREGEVVGSVFLVRA